MQLRDYQQQAIDRLLDRLDYNPILVAPTGSGKTVMASAFVKQHSRNTLWLAHRTELIGQAEMTLHEKYGLDTARIQADAERDYSKPVQVASVQTLVNATKIPAADLIVVDECHHATGATYQKILDWYPKAPVIGLTATPYRLDGKGLGDIFGDIIVSATMQELIDRGILHKPKVWSHSMPDLRGVRKLAGEYNLKQVSDVIDTAALVGDIVDTWKVRAEGRKTVVYAVNIEHSKHITKAFNDAGISAAHIDGHTSKEERRGILKQLRTGSLQVISNCMILTEGWDFPALECAVIARPTASLCLHLQMLGRIVRSAEGKDGCVVLDHAGNHLQHGSVTRPVAYTLDGLTKASKSEPLDVKQCSECFVFFDSKLSICPDCGHEIKAASRRTLRTVDGDLVEYDEDSFQYRSDSWDVIEQQRMAAGYKPGWSFYRYEEQFGEKPQGVVDGIMADPDGDIDHKRKIWRAIEDTRLAKGYKTGWAAHRYKTIFGVWPSGVMSEKDRLVRKLERMRNAG